MENPSPKSIIIIGGGASGVLTAIQLLHSATKPLHLYLIEERPEVGLGVAYGTTFLEHLLNVPAEGMSIFPPDPAHFHQWLQVNYPDEYCPHDFAPRQMFGQYIQAVFQDALQQKPFYIQVTICQAKAIDIQLDNEEVFVQLNNGQCLRANKVVLALGNFPPANPVTVDSSWSGKGLYFANPWDTRLFEDVQPLKEVLLIGSGLTAIDIVIAHQKRGFQGRFHLVSTHGLLPRVHDIVNEHSLAFQEDELPQTLTAYSLYQLFKQEMRRASNDWRAVIQAFRALTPVLWQKMPVKEQAKFMRRLAPWWNVHRHRLAPSIAAFIEDLQASGRLQLWKGRVASLQESSDGLCATITSKSQMETIMAQRIINCTGPQSNFGRLAQQDELIHHLLSRSLIRPDALRAGLDALPNGQLLGSDGKPSPYLFTLGTPMKGILFECTSIPEIRQHAEKLAITLLQ